MNRKLVLTLTLTFLIGTLSVALNVQSAKASGTIYIRADGSINPPDAPISTLDNVTYTLTGNVTSDADGIVVEKDDIVVDGTGHTLNGSGGAGRSTGIELSHRSNVTIRNMKITRFGYGIYLRYSSNNTIFRNNMTANYYCGINGYSSKYNNISKNNIADSNSGICPYGASDYTTISGNNITATKDFAICPDSSSNTDICGNNIEANNGSGIRLRDSLNSSIYANNIVNNGYGIYLLESSNSIAYHNNLVGNKQQVYDAAWYYDLVSSVNAWNDSCPSGGNYWSDYDGTDANQDGIGDTPYVIDVNNTDHYPLMGRFSDFKTTTEHHVQTVCNSSISSFQYNGTAMSFNVSGENDTTGFCRVCVPTALMNATYKVFINRTEVSYNLLSGSNETCSYLYINYAHSTQELIIIPEFPSFLILPLLMIAALLAVIVYRRKHAQRE
jgi:parallel beta-helix repeat protein